jgi:hypothetical protein
VSKRKTRQDIEQFIFDNRINVSLLDMFYKTASNGRNRLFIVLKCANGHIMEQLWDNFKQGHRCKECSNDYNSECRTKYTKEFVEDYLFNNGYLIKSEYKDSGTPFVYECLTCGNQAKTNFGQFLIGRRCGVCKNKSLKTTEKFIKEVFELTNGEYQVLGEYIEANIKMNMKHTTCGYEYPVTPHNFLRDKRCPNCIKSRGEVMIEEFLIENKINYISQYRIHDCRRVNPLPFDFAIFDDKNKLSLLIEYDGRQHFESVDYFGGEKSLNYTKENDEIKNTYCKENNIQLLRIPYFEFNNINNILGSELCNFN